MYVRKDYRVEMEISGDIACFTDPSSRNGACFTSYPIPTWSAVKGMFEKLYYLEGVYMNPILVRICAPIKYVDINDVYLGPSRKADACKADVALQRCQHVLSDVCYQIVAQAECIDGFQANYNIRHRLQDNILNRLKHGTGKQIALGFEHCPCSYVGFCRETTKVEPINMTIPSLLKSMWDKPQHGMYNPTYVNDTKIIDGEYLYDQHTL